MGSANPAATHSTCNAGIRRFKASSNSSVMKVMSPQRERKDSSKGKTDCARVRKRLLWVTDLRYSASHARSQPCLSRNGFRQARFAEVQVESSFSKVRISKHSVTVNIHVSSGLGIAEVQVKNICFRVRISKHCALDAHESSGPCIAVDDEDGVSNRKRTLKESQP